MDHFKYCLAKVAVPFIREAILSKDLERFIGNNNIVLLDVRTEAEWEEFHITGSIHIDYYSDVFFDELKELDRDKEYIVYCKAGVRSAGAIIYMKMLSFKNITNVQDGIYPLFNKKEI